MVKSCQHPMGIESKPIEMPQTVINADSVVKFKYMLEKVDFTKFLKYQFN